MHLNEVTQIFTLANEFKEGDLLVGGTRDQRVRNEARETLASLRLGEIGKTAFVGDRVSEVLGLAVDPTLSNEISRLTVDEVKRLLLAPGGAEWARRYRDGLTSESIAAVAKLMTNDELGSVSRSIFNPLPGDGIAIGSSRHFGSRIQPNSPGDNEEEILFSILEGLSYGCGDVIIGLNPASDDVDTIIRLEELLRSVVERLALPTRYTVLSDIVKQDSARSRTRVDVGFQSLAGTSKAINGMVGLDIEGLLDLARGFAGLYFETGQGSAVTNQAAEGVDMVTLEARAYGVARYLRQRTGSWMIVNDVAGFIGPEVFRTGDQLLRACLEDTMMAKLHGITMGLDVCATFHMGIEPRELHELTQSVVELAAPAYLMAVAGNADPMLGYLTTSFREHPSLRLRSGKQISSAMQDRLAALGTMNEAAEARGNGVESLYAIYQKASGDTRATETLSVEASKKIGALGERGFDLGYGWGGDIAAPPEATSRLDSIYSHARRSLYATLDDAVISVVSPKSLRIRTAATDRDDYLAHPSRGEAICEEDASRVRRLYSSSRPAVQVVISDGLNPNAINENLRVVLPAVRKRLELAGHNVGSADIVIVNGRVRAGYHVAALLDVELLIHFIGERPGTGIDTMSAYLTYGRDEAGRSRWGSDVDHSWTTAVCSIHRRAKAPDLAAEEIAGLVDRMFETHRSGVALN